MGVEKLNVISKGSKNYTISCSFDWLKTLYYKLTDVMFLGSSKNVNRTSGTDYFNGGAYDMALKRWTTYTSYRPFRSNNDGVGFNFTLLFLFGTMGIGQLR